MAESTTDSSKGTAPASKMSRIRFQRAKPNLSGVAGRRPGPASVSNVSTAAVPSPQPLSRIPPPPPSIIADEIVPPAVVVAAATVEPIDRVLSPPPIRRITSNLPASNDVSDPISPVDARIPDAPSISDGQSTTVKMATVTTPACSKNKQNPSADDVFVKPSTTVHTYKQKKRKISSLDADKEVVTQKRQKKVRLGKTEKNKMTMFDFIHWNPASNPMVYDEEEGRVPLADKQTNVDEPNSLSQRLDEENVDNPEEAQPTLESGENDDENVGEQPTAAGEVEEENDAMPVPQVKIGPDGNIILDEQSLVIETTASKTNVLSNAPAVYEHSSNTTYSSYRKKKPCKNWREKETAKFFMALSSVGTDFSLMENFFPKRTRHELKLKFKREERLNRHLVEKAINDRQQFDLSLIGDDTEDEENELDSGISKAKSNCRRRYSKTGNKRGRKPKETGTKDDVTGNAGDAVENAGDGVVANSSCKRKYKRRRTLQVESDSDEEAAEEVVVEEDSPKRSKKTLQKNKKNSKIPKKRNATENGDEENSDVISVTVAEATQQQQISVSDEQVQDEGDDRPLEGDDDESESDEVVDSLLQKTRSGRQPKKNSVFTIDATKTSKRRGKRKSKCVTVKRMTPPPLRPIAATANEESTSPMILSPNQLILLAEKPVGCGSQVIHLLMYSPSAHATGATPVRLDINTSGSSPPQERSLPSLTEHDYASDSAETPSGDNVELQAAISQLTNGTGNDNVITYDAAAVSC